MMWRRLQKTQPGLFSPSGQKSDRHYRSHDGRRTSGCQGTPPSHRYQLRLTQEEVISSEGNGWHVFLNPGQDRVRGLPAKHRGTPPHGQAVGFTGRAVHSLYLKGPSGHMWHGRRNLRDKANAKADTAPREVLLSKFFSSGCLVAFNHPTPRIAGLRRFQPSGWLEGKSLKGCSE
jgi:hypothetical protein